MTPNSQMPGGTVDFLSCDSTFIDIPSENGKTTKGNHLPSIADHFQTDKLPKFTPKPLAAPFPFSLCKCRLDRVSLVGSFLVSLLLSLVLAFVIYWVASHYDKIETPGRAIAIISAILVAILASAVFFIYGSKNGRSSFMIPFLFVTLFGVMAQIGSTAVLFLTLYEDANEKYSKDTTENLTICILLRLIPLVLIVIQLYFFVCFVKSFMFVRRTRPN
ncbi:hypothetical protein PFISCL1PPCAC_16786 [Pristionchus fissidentatus]|uniref:Uncharacterized protein n=1 Tax=Pristionchus fissidentatus TaxID=1538716 RepID=A0AAV5W0S5_9BILA|nr:hypothetical protein PFISCL1PPCAC_16786 [Pristionchus fissidentatus]